LAQSKKTSTKRDQRRLRAQQILFTTIAIILILSWIIGLVSK